MDFIDTLKQFSSRVEMLKDGITTEEATKMSLIVPFFQLLGYDVFNPTEFCPEYTADVGIKKGEKVDYAIILNGSPEILIECKWSGQDLDKHSSQLFRYFGTTKAKFGILTNGIVYQFFTDLDEPNKMDLTPFLEFNILDLSENLVNEIKKFHKDSFDSNRIFSTASELKYSKAIKELLSAEQESPTDEFIRFLLNNVYDGQKNQKVIERFRPIVKRAFSSYINETMNQKISSALSSSQEQESTDENVPESKIITTQEELDSYYIIRAILASTVDIKEIAYRDTESYFGVLYKDNNRKPICRLYLDKKKKQLMVPNEDKTWERIYIDTIEDLYQHADKFMQIVKRYIN